MVFWYYPYLADTSIIPWPQLKNKSVLEVGLGYGSVGRRGIQYGTLYTALDVAKRPIDFLSKTTQQSNATFLKESALTMPFSDDTFDYVISIGCLHHTGDLPKALNECIRVLKSGGTVVLMVYNALSYKRWITRPLETFRRKSHICTGKKTPERVGKDAWWYDRNMDGAAAPSTVFTTKSEMRELLTNISIQSIEIKNIDKVQDLLPLGLQIRAIDRVRIATLILTFIMRIGLDIYAVATKL